MYACQKRKPREEVSDTSHSKHTGQPLRLEYFVTAGEHIVRLGEKFVTTGVNLVRICEDLVPLNAGPAAAHEAERRPPSV